MSDKHNTAFYTKTCIISLYIYEEGSMVKKHLSTSEYTFQKLAHICISLLYIWFLGGHKPRYHTQPQVEMLCLHDRH